MAAPHIAVGLRMHKEFSMANRRARRAVRKTVARFSPQPAAPSRRPHPGLLPRTCDFHLWLSYIERVYAGHGAKEQQ